MMVDLTITRGDTMPVVPHYPSDEPRDREVPDPADIVDRIINGGETPDPGAV